MTYFYVRLVLIVALLAAASPALAADRQRPNVLFIAIDDLRTNLGCYGDETAITPNLDALAQQGVAFQRAYCQVAVCNPSRQSLLTGQRPDTIRVWNHKTHFRQTAPHLVSLPEHFKNHGYHAQSIGKIYHGQPGMSDPPSWSAPEQLATVGKGAEYAQPPKQEKQGKGKSYEMTRKPEEELVDGRVAALAIEALRDRPADRPFFLAVGFRKPHLPFRAPQKYWDLYDRSKIPAPDPASAPASIPSIHLHDSVELRGYVDMPDEGAFTAEQIVALRHGYYACTSFMDAQVGKVIEELDRLALRQNTVIVLWSDHGFHLGEKGLWAKTTNFELDARVPLIVSAPQQQARGTRSDGLVELIDLFPTLVELCGLPAPAQPLEGHSFAPLLNEPERPWKRGAFSQFMRPWRQGGAPERMGYSVRTERYRYVEWVQVETGQVVARELYDNQSDPRETMNLADREANVAVVDELSALLKTGWQGALPRETAQPAGD